MIASIHNVSGFAGIQRYIINKPKVTKLMGEDVEGLAAERIGGTIHTSSLKSMTKEFRIIPNRLKHPGKHLSLSIPIGDSIPNKQWLRIAKDVMKSSGYGDGQWICYKHTDTDHEHVHLVMNRKNYELKTVSDSNEKYKFMAIMREMEEKYDLTRYVEDKTKVKESTLEARLSQRGIVTDKKELNSRIRLAVMNSNNWLDFANQLKIRDIEWNPRKNNEGVETGARYTCKGKTYAGSKVGFSLQRVEEIFFEQNENLNKKLEKPAKKTVSATQFAQIVVDSGSTEMLNNILSKRSDDLKYIIALREGFENVEVEDKNLEKSIRELFEKYENQLEVKPIIIDLNAQKLDKIYLDLRELFKDPNKSYPLYVSRILDKHSNDIIAKIDLNMFTGSNRKAVEKSVGLKLNGPKGGLKI